MKLPQPKSYAANAELAEASDFDWGGALRHIPHREGVEGTYAQARAEASPREPTGSR